MSTRIRRWGVGTAVLAAGFGGTLAALAAPVAAPNATPEQAAFFESKVRPLLAERCYSCHGPKVAQAGLRLDSRDGLLKGADTGPVLQPGDPEHSRLLRSIRYTDAVKMPPTGRLRADEISVLETWVRQGAPWPPERMQAEGGRMKGPHWSFQPVARPAIPKVKNAAWVRNPVDAFVLAELEKRGLTPAPPADRLTLIRRVTYDLTGLPPTVTEIDAFLRECDAEQEQARSRSRSGRVGERESGGKNSPLSRTGSPTPPFAHSPTPLRENTAPPRAYAQLIDRLLASPAYGERWGRKWLDVVRYADTAGETADYPVPQAYRYRNWVIDAFNKDLPYDRFLREQLAGDLLAASGPPEEYANSVTATGFLAISRRFGFDPENYHHLTIEDTLDTVGKSMLGLTIGCARCHDHKFDPVPTADYYSLYGIFASTRYAFPGSEEKKRPRDFVPLVPPAEATRRQQEYDTALATLDGEAKRLQGERSALQAQVGQDGDFELEADGELPGLPWINGPNSQARARSTAQSPFTHLFSPGRLGVAFQNDAVYSGFGQPVAPGWTAAPAKRLYYNADFRNTSLQAGGSGSIRYYAGHGPGNSAAVEFFVDGERFYVRNGAQIEPVRELKPGQWYNVQLTLDLETRTFSGTVGTPGDLTPISSRQFHPAWDGTIDYFFVDSYGHRGGVRPGHEVDQLALRATPLPPPSLAPRTGEPTADLMGLRARLRGLETQLADLERRRAERMEKGPYEVAYAVSEGTPQNAHIQLRGDPRTPGAEVSRHFLTAFGAAPLPAGTPGSGRLALAEWIADPKNPLTARVMVNRVWQGHFSRGLVRTPNDFGTRGAPPTHPALLDYLASTLVSGNLPTPNTQHPTPATPWSLKSLHRLLMLSNTYQMSSEEDARTLQLDPENRLLTRQNRRRLEAEEIRDTLLSVSGELDRTMGGPHPFPPVSSWGFTQHTPFTAVYETKRRSVYLMTQRIRKHPFLALFDGAEPNGSTPERVATTTPIQALFALNDPFVHAQAAALARRLQAAGPDPAARIDLGYRLCLGRPSTPAEQREAATFLTAAREGEGAEVELRALTAFARVLLGSNELFFVD